MKYISFSLKNYYRRHFGSSSYYGLYWDFFATPIALSKMAFVPTFQYPQCHSDTTTVVVLNEDGLSLAPVRTNRDVLVLAQERHASRLVVSELTGLFWEADGLHDNESDFLWLRQKYRNGWLE